MRGWANLADVWSVWRGGSGSSAGQLSSCLFLLAIDTYWGITIKSRTPLGFQDLETYAYGLAAFLCCLWIGE